MNAREPTSGPTPEVTAQRSADRLALALEEVGFDVGRAFPELNGRLSHDGAPVVELGVVTASVATRLADALSRAAGSPPPAGQRRR